MAGTRGAPGATLVLQANGVDTILADIQFFDAAVKRLVNGQLRRASKQIAAAALPVVRSAVAGSPVPQAGAMAATARAKSDRRPVVVVGAVNPKLSGWRRGGNPRWKGSLAFGAELGGKQAWRVHKPGGGTYVRGNIYRAGRSSGYGIGRNTARIADAIVPAYYQALVDILNRSAY
jgi:hypothetical protein